MPDPIWGQVVKAFVVPRASLRAQEVREFCRKSGQLATFKVPREVQLVAEIPTNPSGKVLKRELRELTLRGEYAVGALASAGASAARDLLKESLERLGGRVGVLDQELVDRRQGARRVRPGATLGIRSRLSRPRL